MIDHVLKSDQFDRKSLEYIYNLTNRIRQYDKSREGLLYLQSLLQEKRAMLYFTQASTRTFLSFQSACHILGLKTLEIRDPSTSSEYKGESLTDSLRTFSSYVDLIIMRSPISGLCDLIAQKLSQTPRSVPIINAGSGQDEHPTQAILDIYTIMRSFKGSNEINSKTVCFVGDLKRGRTIRSLANLLIHFDNIKMVFVSPQEYKMEEDLRQKLNEHGIDFIETDDFKSSLAIADVIYMTRIQCEYDQKNDKNYHQYALAPYCLKKSHLDIIHKNAIIMHPLPRREELDIAIDDDPRAMYWRQERNGMWTRSALITMVLGVHHQIIPLQL